MTTLDWNTLSFDTPKDMIASVITDEDWQILRRSLKGQALELKHAALSHWVAKATNPVMLFRRQVQVGNYVNALRRAGLVPPRK